MLKNRVVFILLCLTATLYSQNRVLVLDGNEDHISFAQPVMTTPKAEMEWHHMAGVISGGWMTLYIDGELAAGTPYTQEGSLSNNISTVALGKHHQDSMDYGFFNGMIDEFRVWDYGLSGEEIQLRMNEELTGNEQGLIAYLNFNDSTANDQSNHANDGVFVGDAITITEDVFIPQDAGWGDLNEDGHVNISDVIVLINNILGL